MRAELRMDMAAHTARFPTPSDPYMTHMTCGDHFSKFPFLESPKIEISQYIFLDDQPSPISNTQILG